MPGDQGWVHEPTTATRWCAVAAVAALALAGCVGSSPLSSSRDPGTNGSSPSPSVVATSSSLESAAAPSTTALASPSAPITWGDATFVSGTLRFTITEGDVSYEDDGSSRSRNGSLDAAMVSNDPRVSGTVTGTWHSDRWGTQFDGALVQWGTAVLENEGGSWEADYSGVYISETGDQITRWYVGKGGYEGLTFYMWITDGRTMSWAGLIYRGTPPPYP